jgi:hypothetical protein
MGFGHFDSANLAVVAYAKVAADGTLLAASNLEYLTPHLPNGQYVLGPPFNIQGVREPLFSQETLYIITPLDQGTPKFPMLSQGPPYAIILTFYPLVPPGPPVDSAFSLLVLRPLIKAPTP